MHRSLRIAASILCLAVSAHADLDLDTNGLGDVWEAKFHPETFALSEDDDGDGRTNLDEFEAGTDPLRAEDVFAIRELDAVAGNLVLRWPSQAGKRYQIQSTGTPGAADSWQSLPGQHPGDGGDLEISTLRPATPRAFFRVVVADVDTDGDGLTDWEELQAGFDPNAPQSHGCHCTNCQCGPDCGCGVDDLESLTQALQAPPMISVEATDDVSVEPPVGVAADTGMVKVKRHGGIRRTVVNLQREGSAMLSDISTLPATVVVPLAADSVPVAVVPMPDTLAESTETVLVSIAPGTDYTVEAGPPAAVLIHDAVLANGTGLRATYWQHEGSAPATTATSNNNPRLTGTPNLTRIDPTVDFGTTTPGSPWSLPGMSLDYFTSRWEGEVLPEFSQAYTFFTHNDNAGRLWVNGQLLINNWPAVSGSTSEKSAVIVLQGGKRYRIVHEHYENGGSERAVLSWQSQNQDKQVIPQSRLFPDTPPRILGPFEGWAFVGQTTFSSQVITTGNAVTFSSSGLPDDFDIDPQTGLLTGTPMTAGTWKATVTATNPFGSDSAFLELTVIETSGGITRELWTGVQGSSVADIPLTKPPLETSLLNKLEGPTDSGDDYGARIRGFVTAPASGDYRFFLRGDEAAEFYLSDDDEPVNAWKRAELTDPSGSAYWTTAAQSPLLRLEAGRRYYLEIRHKEDAGGDHLALGWSRPGEPDNTASEIVPGYCLTRFEDVALGSSPDGTLSFTPLTPQAGAVTNAYGSCTMRLSADKTTAWITPIYGNLGSPFQGMHVHDDRLPPSSNIVFDLDEPGVEVLADGSYVWHIQDTGTLTAAEIADGIGQHAFFNVHTVTYPGGEIKGYFRALDGSTVFTPPPVPPDWTTETTAAHTDAEAAARFLQQATFGANPDDIITLTSAASYDAWIDDEFEKPVTKHLPYVEQFRNATSANSSAYPGDLSFNSWWKNSIQGDDQLRQRIAFALSEIMVVSESGPLDDRANAVSDYYDTLLQHSFGNARELLEAVTLHPAMGRYLDMLRNDKPDLTKGSIPNENYAREILQLFSLGLYRFHLDGSLILNSKGLPIPVYDQDAIIGYAHVFTGWDYFYTGGYRTTLGASTNWTEPMREVPARHFTGKKRLLNNIVLPGIPMLGGVPLDPYGAHNGAGIANDLQFQALASQELEAVHDQIFNHPNFGPFLCRQLIQRLVTSTPSRGYIYRVVSKFNDNGSGVRGDMRAVIKAILLDYEARSPVASTAPGYGKQREPVVRVTQLARAFRPENNFAGTYTQDGGIITVDTAPFAHRLVAGQKVLLGFSGTDLQSTDADYSVATVPNTSSFTVAAKDAYRCTWSQTGSTITVTTPVNHPFVAGESLFLRFRYGTGGVLTDGVHPIVGQPGTTTFAVAAPDGITRSGDCDVSWIRGIYAQSYNSSTNVTVLTASLSNPVGLALGDKLDIRFTPSTGQTTAPPHGRYTIVEPFDPLDPRRVTLKPDSGIQSTLNSRTGAIHGLIPAPDIDRSGTAVSGYSDWGVNGTDTDLGQTPLRSPTVFNFFEPDYKHPGILAANGLVTPEFQLSSETNVIRQANFLFGGIYSASSSITNGYTNGFSSFKGNAHDIMMDFSPWMRPRTLGGTDFWTNTANLRALIQEISKILMAGQMSLAMEDQIFTHVSNTTNVTYNTTTPSDADRRNRVRAVIYFIAVSPEHAIQR